MLTVNGDLVTLFSGFVGSAFTAFTPLFSAIVGLFIAFAIADRLRFNIGRMIKK
jgi:mannose/fructose/N-acetylgalactosamine-specific phosphotransferase system component IIC